MSEHRKVTINRVEIGDVVSTPWDVAHPGHVSARGFARVVEIERPQKSWTVLRCDGRTISGGPATKIVVSDGGVS